MTLAELVAQLEVAVRGRDRGRARGLEQEFLQRVATEAADRAGLERRVRALMAELDQPAARPHPLRVERYMGGPSSEAAGVVYPATNRKAAAQSDGFTGERHDRVTRGDRQDLLETLVAFQPARRPLTAATCQTFIKPCKSRKRARCADRLRP